jgi:Tfp pilus assembly protein PilN
VKTLKDINLLPDEVKPDLTQQATIEKVKKDTKRSISVKTILISILVVIIMVAPIVATKLYDAQLDKDLISLNNELTSNKYMKIRQLNNDLKSINAIIETKKDIINSINSQNYSVYEMIVTLKHVIPEGCKLNNLNYNSKTLNITMQTSDFLQTGEFLMNANRLEFLSLSDSAKSLNVSKNSQLSFSFNVGRKLAN